MLKYISFLNPSAWSKQTILLFTFLFLGGLGWEFITQKFLDKPCPPSTSINNDIQTKGNSKKGGTTTIDLGLTNDQSDTDCYTREELLEMGVKERQLNKAGVQ